MRYIQHRHNNNIYYSQLKCDIISAVHRCESAVTSRTVRRRIEEENAESLSWPELAAAPSMGNGTSGAARV